MESESVTVDRRVPWNKGKLTGKKPPLKLREIWAIRTRLQMASNIRELAMINLAIDSKLRACDLTRLQGQDIRHGSHVAARATVMQQKTRRSVQFEITEQIRESLEALIEARGLKAANFLFPSRLHTSPHLSTRQYARIVHRCRIYWPRRYRICHPHYAPYKSLAYLPPDEESSGGTAAPRAYKAGKHSSLSSWHRSQTMLFG